MAGEIEHSTAAEIKDHAAAATTRGRRSIHFYTATKVVQPDVWKAIAIL